jgi:hypothetical protein
MGNRSVRSAGGGDVDFFALSKAPEHLALEAVTLTPFCLFSRCSLVYMRNSLVLTKEGIGAYGNKAVVLYSNSTITAGTSSKNRSFGEEYTTSIMTVKTTAYVDPVTRQVYKVVSNGESIPLSNVWVKSFY